MKLIVRWARQFGRGASGMHLLLLLALVPLRIADPRPLEELRLRTFDLFQVLRPREQTARPVVIVDIDEASLKEIGQWPWPRTIVADLVTRLHAARRRRDRLRRRLRRARPHVAGNRRGKAFAVSTPETRDKLASLPSNDEVLADAIKRAARRGRPSRRRRRRPRAADEAALQTGFAVRGPDPRPFLVTFPGLAAQRARRSSRRRPAAACSPSIPSATASSAGCRSSWRRRVRWCRR